MRALRSRIRAVQPNGTSGCLGRLCDACQLAWPHDPHDLIDALHRSIDGSQADRCAVARNECGDLSVGLDPAHAHAIPEMRRKGGNEGRDPSPAADRNTRCAHHATAIRVRHAAGNLYGATWGDGAYNHGNVFKQTPTKNGWTYSSVHDFTGSPDGASASGGLAIDSNGVIYGTTYEGGSDQCYCGVVFQITP